MESSLILLHLRDLAYPIFTRLTQSLQFDLIDTVLLFRSNWKPFLVSSNVLRLVSS